MLSKFRIAYFAHSVRSDWNNGNAHFLRGLMRSLIALGHEVTVFEPEDGWSIHNLRAESLGERSLQQFTAAYPELPVRTYLLDDRISWTEALREKDIVIVHEWNSPMLAQLLLALRGRLKFRLLFHDTHHRASSSPDQIRLFGLDRFDGVLAFGDALRRIYRESFNLTQVWTLHEAADVTMFHPIPDSDRINRDADKTDGIVWIGNWGDEERTAEISTYFLAPALHFPRNTFTAYGVRYPEEARLALQNAGVEYGGYLPNLDGPRTYAAARATVHIPRQAYTAAMHGIPTIRVFEALACGIPLISAPWKDTEHLFDDGDYYRVSSAAEMTWALQFFLKDRQAAEQQAEQGFRTVLSRHTCMHRAEQLTAICEEILQ